jgi:acyl dehydratase
MLTMGIAVQPVVEWLGARGTVVDYQVRFTKPVFVDAADGATVSVVAKVGVVDDDGARIDLTVTYNGATVLGKAQVRVALASR